MAKKNKNNKKKGPKGQRKKKNGRMGGRGGTANLMSYAMQVCSITNPFCDEAKGAKWPDNAFARTVGFPMFAATTLSTDASGYAAMLYLPNFALELAAGVMAGPVATFTTSAPLSSFGALTGVQRWRLVSWGVKISCISPMMTTQGRLRVRMFSPMQGTSLGTIDTTTPLADAMLDIPMGRVIEKDLFVISAPLGDVARLYRTTSASGLLTDFENPGWQCILIAINGGMASTPMLSVTAYYNYELSFADNSSTQMLATRPVAPQPRVIEASAGVISTVGNFVEGAADRVDKIMQSKALKYIAAGVGAFIGGPAGAAAGFSGTKGAAMMIRDVD